MAALESLLSQKGSDSGLHIQLHPLVILSISDHITRHAACQQQGPIIGALLGQQNGRDITLEHAFECVVVESPDGELSLPPDWFIERVKQFKDVHKDPPLDIVGWWATAPPSGPTPSHLPIQRQVLQDYNESAVFLAFHPSLLQNSPSSGGKLPLTVYESVYEGDHADGERKMQVDDEEQSLNIRFRELPYSVETGEAEMIGVDTVSRSGRTAVANDGSAQQPQQRGSHSETGGKDTEATILSAEDEELIASLNTRLNAIRTLESRISLIKSYLSTVSPPSEDVTNLETQQHLSHPILRNINSVLSHLSLLTPPGESPLTAETLLQNNDVLLVSMMGQLSKSIKGMREVGRKAGIVRSAKQNAMSRKAQFAMQSRFEDEYLARDGDAGSIPLGRPSYT